MVQEGRKLVDCFLHKKYKAKIEHSFSRPCVIVRILLLNLTLSQFKAHSLDPSPSKKRRLRANIFKQLTQYILQLAGCYFAIILVTLHSAHNWGSYPNKGLQKSDNIMSLKSVAYGVLRISKMKIPTVWTLEILTTV